MHGELSSNLTLTQVKPILETRLLVFLVHENNPCYRTANCKKETNGQKVYVDFFAYYSSHGMEIHSLLQKGIVSIENCRLEAILKFTAESEHVIVNIPFLR